MKTLCNFLLVLLLGQHAFATNTNPETFGDSLALHPPMATVSVTVVGNGTVNSAALWSDPVNCPSDCSGQAPGFAQLYANPAPGWCFLGWSGSASGSMNPLAADFFPGGSYTATFVLKPTITSHPVSQGACPGTGVSFSVTATNGVAYQWQASQGFGWFDLSDYGVYSNVTSATMNISDVAGLNNYQFRCAVNGGNCVMSNPATLTVYSLPTTSAAGPDQTICSSSGSATMAGNTPLAGTGIWTKVSGPAGGAIATPSSPTATITGMTSAGTYVFRWTITNAPCGSSFDQVSVTVAAPPTIANAGPDQTGAATCGLTQVTLAANTPTVGTGAWSIVSGAGGSFGNAASPNSTFTGTAGSTYTLRWTITSNPCTASSDDVVVTFNRTPTAANAGPDQTGAATCGLTQVTLAANTPTVGTGAWSIVSGAGGSFGNAASPNSTFTGTAGSTYTLRWTITGNPCTASSDDVVVTFNRTPTAANAGPDQTGAATCGLTQVTLAANTPTVGTGTWSIVSGAGGSFGNAASPASTFSGTAGSTYTLRWTITGSPCAASSDNVVVTFNRNPTAANAGPDQTGAATCGLTQVTLAANTPTVGTGAWSIVSGAGGSFGNAASPNSTFTGTAGSTYTLRWTITGNPCTASSDDVVVTFNRTPTAANAGPDQTGAATCGLTQVTLAANTPTVGTGAWSIVSGAGGSFGNAASPNSTFSGTAGSTYTLRWTITGSPCAASSDNVVVTFNRNPTAANAGPDQTGAATCGLTQVTLAANTPTVGTGAWSIVSGAGGSFGNAASPASTFTGTAGSTYTLRWTITGSPCAASSDDVVVTFNRTPTAANAGPDQTGAATCGLTQVTLAANAPTVGTGTWSIVSGAGGSFGNAASPASTFSGTAGNTYTLRWTISSSPCTASSDDVVVTFNQNPAVTCPGNTTVHYSDPAYALSGGLPVGGTYSGPGVNGGMFHPSVAGGGTHTIIYSYTNAAGCSGSCTFTITVNASVSCPANSTVCISEPAFVLTGGSPAGGTYSGPGVSDGMFDPAAAGAGIHTITYTNGNTCNFTVTVASLPTAANAGPDQTGAATCGLTQVTLAANSPAVGTGAWSVVSGAGGSFGNAASPASTFSGTAGNTYTLRWTISSSPCTASSDDVMVTFHQNPAVTCPGNTTVNIGDPAFALTGGTPAGGDYAGPGVGDGVFGPLAAGVGNHTITYAYVDAAGCSGSCTFTITVNASVSCPANSTVCISEPAFVLTGGSPAGGTYSGPGVSDGMFDPAAAGAGIHTITYTNGNTCNFTVTVASLPTAANAGPDQTGAATCGLTQVTLAANTPTVGTGAWSVVSGAGGSFGNAASPASTFSGTAGNTYTLRWSVSNSPCTASSDDVMVTFHQNPAVTCPGNTTVNIGDPAFALSGGTPAGGDYAGPGVGDGVFGPLAAGVGNHMITYAYVDAAGCAGTCSFTIYVDNGADIQISGVLLWEYDDQSGVGNATVTLGGDQNGSVITPSAGTFSFSVDAGSNLTVTPAKNTDKLNGVTAADATRIQQHLAGIDPITDPYQLVAADVNKTNSVTSLDASVINQALLGNQAALQQFKTSWRFVPVAHTMNNPPWGFPEAIVLNNVNGDLPEVDFYGIKTGDVENGDADPANLGAAEALVLNIADRWLEAGQPLSLAFSANQFDDLAALQLALHFDPQALALTGITPSAGLPLAIENFGLSGAAQGDIRVVWSQAKGLFVPEAAPVFQITFNVLQGGSRLSDVLRLDEEVLPGRAYTGSLAESAVRLNVSGLTGTSDPAGAGVQLLQNRPNPFAERTVIGFVLPVAGDARLRVFDATGRLLAEQSGHYPAGRSEETFILPCMPGVLFYELITPSGTLTRTMTMAAK